MSTSASVPSLQQGQGTIAFLLAHSMAAISAFAGEAVGEAALALSQAVAMGTQNSLLQRRALQRPESPIEEEVGSCERGEWKN